MDFAEGTEKILSPGRDWAVLRTRLGVRFVAGLRARVRSLAQSHDVHGDWSMAVFSLLLIQLWQLSITGESTCMSTSEQHFIFVEYEKKPKKPWSRFTTKATKWHVCPAKTQISLGSKDSDQTVRKPRLIWVFAGHICRFVGFIMGRLIFSSVVGFSDDGDKQDNRILQERAQDVPSFNITI